MEKGFSRENENEMYLKFDNYLEINYTNSDQSKNKFTTEDQVSWINLEKDSILIDKAGRYYETFSIKTAGLWSLEKMSDLLPYEYFYDNSKLLF